MYLQMELCRDAAYGSHRGAAVLKRILCGYDFDAVRQRELTNLLLKRAEIEELACDDRVKREWTFGYLQGAFGRSGHDVELPYRGRVGAHALAGRATGVEDGTIVTDEEGFHDCMSAVTLSIIPRTENRSRGPAVSTRPLATARESAVASASASSTGTRNS